MGKKPGLFSTAPVIQHSVATPLTNILLNTEIAVQNLERGKEATEIYLQRVLLNAKHLNSVLELAESSTTVFSPKKALDELVMFNQHTRLKQHLVSRIFLPAECLFQGNKLAFQEMVVCLLNNAYESYLAAKNRLVFLSATVENDLLKLVVTDGGRGMSWLAKTLSVSPLYTSKNNHAGLGLYFVKKTIEAEFSGKLLLRSRLHKGTSATLLFPLKSNQAITEPSSSFYY